MDYHTEKLGKDVKKLTISEIKTNKYREERSPSIKKELTMKTGIEKFKNVMNPDTYRFTN